MTKRNLETKCEVIIAIVRSLRIEGQERMRTRTGNGFFIPMEFHPSSFSSIRELNRRTDLTAIRDMWRHFLSCPAPYRQHQHIFYAIDFLLWYQSWNHLGVLAT
ncbi:hypothetical protein V6N13_148507 [Hibiscus sabdariffa]